MIGDLELFAIYDDLFGRNDHVGEEPGTLELIQELRFPRGRLRHYRGRLLRLVLRLTATGGESKGEGTQEE